MSTLSSDAQIILNGLPTETFKPDKTNTRGNFCYRCSRKFMSTQQIVLPIVDGQQRKVHPRCEIREI